MPTYQYACTECGNQLEVVQSFADDPLTECPACQGRLRKVFNSVGIVFKGSGFYRTDSRNGGKESSPPSTVAKGDSAKGDSAKSDSGKSGSAGSSSSSDSGSSAGSTSTAKPAASAA
ncbi:FmdB family zinc ribbon protein [Melissospora conviva]|uniref:FmdB family zinc ribbon protein n=1 Tax=Melissospora conviva TaxID=3388432 RepID=UPI003C1C54CE